jgi:hypothetical protein
MAGLGLLDTMGELAVLPPCLGFVLIVDKIPTTLATYREPSPHRPPPAPRPPSPVPLRRTSILGACSYLRKRRSPE